MVNVKDFGAIGDGLTDDSAAISLAISLCGGAYFPSGTYLGSNISVPAGSVLQGPGVLKLKSLAPLNFDPYFRILGDGVTFTGLSFDGNRTGQPADGFSDSWNTGANGTGKSNRAMILGDTYSRVTVQNCAFINCWGASIALRNANKVLVIGNIFKDNNFECAFLYVNGTTRNLDARIMNNSADNIGSGDAIVNANAFVTSNYDGVVCQGNKVKTVERNLIKMENCTLFVVSGNNLDTNTLPGFNSIQGQRGASSGVISNNVLKNVQRGIYFETGVMADIVIEGNEIETALVSAGTPDGIDVVGATGVVIANNRLKNISRHGIDFKNCSGVTVTGNNISPHPSATLSGVGIYGGFLQDGSDIIVEGNLITAGFKGAGASGSGALAIEAPGHTVSYCRIAGNISRTMSGLATDRGIRAISGTFNNLAITDNTTDGIIEAPVGTVMGGNQCARQIPA